MKTNSKEVDVCGAGKSSVVLLDVEDAGPSVDGAGKDAVVKEEVVGTALASFRRLATGSGLGKSSRNTPIGGGGACPNAHTSDTGVTRRHTTACRNIMSPRTAQRRLLIEFLSVSLFATTYSSIFSTKKTNSFATNSGAASARIAKRARSKKEDPKGTAWC